jgi:hypothetical protein
MRSAALLVAGLVIGALAMRLAGGAPKGVEAGATPSRPPTVVELAVLRAELRAALAATHTPAAVSARADPGEARSGRPAPMAAEAAPMAANAAPQQDEHERRQWARTKLAETLPRREIAAGDRDRLHQIVAGLDAESASAFMAELAAAANRGELRVTANGPIF